MPLYNKAATGSVTSVTAGDTSVVIGGTSAAPTVAAGTLDVIATQHAPTADWSNNSHKITSVAAGAASTDAAQCGQVTLAAQQVPATTGYVAWTGDRWTSIRYAATYTTAYPSGSITLCRLNIPFSVTCTGNVDVMWAPGTGTAGSNGYLAVFDSTGTQIAVSADISGHATGWITLATGKTSWAAGFYYCAYVIGTQFGTNGCGPAAFGGELATTSTAAPGDSQPYRTSHQIGGSLTAMPSSLTLGSGWTAWYMNMQFLLR